MVFRTVLVFLLLQAPLLQTVRTNRSRSPIIQRRYRQSIGPLEPGNPLKNDVQGDSGPVLTSTLSSMTGDSGAQRASDALIYWNVLEPDATTICSQLVDVLTGPYYHSHGPFLAEMAEQVQDNIIGPDLRKSLLMIFVQHHREQLRREKASRCNQYPLVLPMCVSVLICPALIRNHRIGSGMIKGTFAGERVAGNVF